MPEPLSPAAMRAFVHELRNVLTVIRGHAQAMGRGAQPEAPSIKAIIAQTDVAKRLIDDPLDASGPGATRPHLRRPRVDLVALTQATVKQAGLLTERHAIRVEAPREHVIGWWDRGRIQQVLENLLSNAIKYAPRGGAIVVRVEGLPVEARLVVRDQGLGIAPSALPHPFERAYRAEATAGVAPGLGLGLSICQGLVEAHGGTIDIASRPDEGTTVVVTLPYEHTAG